MPSWARDRDWASRCRPAALLAASVAFAGCSLIYSSDLSDARSSTAETPRNDAGAGADGATADAGGGADATAPIRGCAAIVPAPKHCRDFDDGAPLESAGWYVDVEQPGGTQAVEIDTTAYSSPNALHATLRDAATCSSARLVKEFPSTGTERLEVRLRVRPSTPWADADGSFILHVNDDSADRCSWILYLQDGDNDGRVDFARVNMQQDGNDVRSLAGSPPNDEWTDFGMVITPAGGGVSIAFSFRREDGTYTETTHAYPTCKLAGKVAVKAGFHCESGTSDIRYDDIRVDWR